MIVRVCPPRHGYREGPGLHGEAPWLECEVVTKQVAGLDLGVDADPHVDLAVGRCCGAGVVTVTGS